MALRVRRYPRLNKEGEKKEKKKVEKEQPRETSDSLGGGRRILIESIDTEGQKGMRKETTQNKENKQREEKWKFSTRLWVCNTSLIFVLCFWKNLLVLHLFFQQNVPMGKRAYQRLIRSENHNFFFTFFSFH